MLAKPNIHGSIVHIRGVAVLLDRDLAAFYGVETRVLKQAVRRNIERFPKDFMFELSQQEMDVLVSQNVIPSKSVFGGALPFVFTEHGVTMLSTVLRTPTAMDISVRIIRSFVALRRHALNYESLAQALAQLEQSTNQRFAEVGKILDALNQQKQIQEKQQTRKRIGYKN